MTSFSLLLKPVSFNCNLHCEYCFYLEKCSLFADTRHHRMDDSILEKTIRTFLKTKQPIYSFGWQGGEPTLIGLDFFKKIVAYQERYFSAGSTITNGLQTNGTLLTNEWAEFLTEQRFLVGISLDGPEDIHNTYRNSHSGKGSYASVIKGIECLKRYSTEFNILTLVSQANIKKPLEVYRFLRDELNCLYHQYIECVEFDQTGNLKDFSISGQEWGDFLCTIFDEWINNDTNHVSVRLFDSIITTMLNKTPTLCSFGQDCRHYFAVEYNGDIYPCDFYVEEEMKLGNIMEDNWTELLSSKKYEAFGQKKRLLDHDCNKCSFVTICAGDCQKNRLSKNTIPYSKSMLCDGWKQFYKYSMPSFKKLVKKLERKKSRTGTNASSHRHIGRNDSCPCGSGQKYKKCCFSN